jgi:L-cysteine:1D-myo-inositol 2-amino-2-deoxy-alpha-D-glucopyranoside ligase
MVRYEGEKMSKSLGNLVFTRDLLRDHEPAAVRLSLLAHHYRSAWEFEADELKVAAERLEAWRRAAGGHAASGRGAVGGRSAGEQAGPAPDPVDGALANDLDTPAALAAVDELAARHEGEAVARAAAILGVEL